MFFRKEKSPPTPETTITFNCFLCGTEIQNRVSKGFCFSTSFNVGHFLGKSKIFSRSWFPKVEVKRKAPFLRSTRHNSKWKAIKMTLFLGRYLDSFTGPLPESILLFFKVNGFTTIWFSSILLSPPKSMKFNCLMWKTLHPLLWLYFRKKENLFLFTLVK